jgi:hypothetical protein
MAFEKANRKLARNISIENMVHKSNSIESSPSLDFSKDNSAIESKKSNSSVGRDSQSNERSLLAEIVKNC